MVYRASMWLMLLSVLLCAGESRFRQVLALYDTAQWRSEDRFASITTEHYRRWPYRRVDSLQDTTAYAARQSLARAGFHLERQAGSREFDARRHLALALALSQHTYGYAMRGLISPGSGSFSSAQDVDERDTVAGYVGLQGDLGASRTEYLSPGACAPGFMLSGVARGQLGYGKEENFDPMIPDSFMIEDKYEDRHGALEIAADLEPGVCLGRQRAIQFVYYAFEVERALIASGAIRFQLADSRLAELARYLARHQSYRLRDHEHIREFKSGLDSILIRDEAADSLSVKLLSPFAIREVFLHQTPAFMAGCQLRLLVGMRLSALGGYRRIHYTPSSIFGPPENPPADSTALYSKLSHDSRLRIALEWGLPLSQQWFMVLRADKPLLTRQDGVTVIGASGAMDWRRVIELRWGVELFKWQQHLTLFGMQVFSAHGSILFEDLPAMIIVPRTWPYHSALRGEFYFEDYFSIGIDLSFYQSRGNDRREQLWSTPFDPPRHGFMPSLHLTYRF